MVDEDEVVGLRLRDSCLLLEIPASLLKEELDFETLWPLEKDCCLGGSKRRENILMDSCIARLDVDVSAHSRRLLRSAAGVSIESVA